MQEKSVHPKIEEYANRVKAGESVDSITQGLPQGMTEALQAEIARREKISLDRKKELEVELGIDTNESVGDGILDAYNKVYRERKMSLRDDMFIVGQGLLPDSDESYEQVNGDIGKHYQAHGIAKTSQLDFLIALLDKGIDKTKPFFTAPFSVPDEDKALLGAALGTSGGEAYKDGLAIVVGERDKHIEESGIKYVFINDIFADLVPHLQKKYSQYEFYKLSDQAKVLI